MSTQFLQHYKAKLAAASVARRSFLSVRFRLFDAVNYRRFWRCTFYHSYGVFHSTAFFEHYACTDRFTRAAYQAEKIFILACFSPLIAQVVRRIYPHKQDAVIAILLRVVRRADKHLLAAGGYQPEIITAVITGELFENWCHNKDSLSLFYIVHPPMPFAIISRIPGIKKGQDRM
jgi:hypothetical protein